MVAIPTTIAQPVCLVSQIASVLWLKGVATLPERLFLSIV
jgi:hypothetical protein